MIGWHYIINLLYHTQLHVCVCVCEWMKEETDAWGNRILQFCICQELLALPLFLSALKLVWMCVCTHVPAQIKQQLQTSPVHITRLCLITYMQCPLVHSAAVQSALHWSPSSITTLCLKFHFNLHVCSKQFWSTASGVSSSFFFCEASWAKLSGGKGGDRSVRWGFVVKENQSPFSLSSSTLCWWINLSLAFLHHQSFSPLLCLSPSLPVCYPQLLPWPFTECVRCKIDFIYTGD